MPERNDQAEKDVFAGLQGTATDQWIAGTLAALARIRDAAVAEKRYGDAEWLERAADDLRRARFHERENYDRYARLRAAIREAIQ